MFTIVMTFAGKKVYIQYNTTDANSELTVDGYDLVIS
jgi:hypothetical protein